MSGECICQWHDLPAELKVEVLRYLPFQSIMRFMLLSRESYFLASQAKIKVFKVQYRGRNQCHILSIAWAKHEKESYSWYEVEILQNSAEGSVIIDSKGRRIYCENDADSVGMQVLFHYTKLFDVQDVEIEELVMSSGLYCMLHGQLDGLTLHAKRFTLSTNDNQLISSLIPFLPSHLSSIVIYTVHLSLNVITTTISSDVFEHEAVRTARELNTESFSADLSDKQICNLKASTLCVSSPHITSRSINQMILQWFKGEREINLIAISTNGDLSWSQLLNEIDPERIQAGSPHGNPDVVAKVLHSDHGNIYIAVCDNYCEMGRPRCCFVRYIPHIIR
ncbi:unnamed protein product [Cylicocyclus nassatus]|uniref:F-box domain-containing protein n=1 Tax=Cylicocyclus nassatus TaxID=53992 RepID=A0AA36DUI9_CYLNA|nr:unnamed protein product [Cylicocyclus nassatus]